MFGRNINQSGDKIDPALAAALQKQGIGIAQTRIAKPVVDRSIRIEQAKREVAHGANTTRVVGDWTRYLANEEIERDGELTSAALHFDAPQWPSVVREVFSDLYAAPGDGLIAEDDQGDSVSSWVASAVETITHVPEWIDLRARTQGDEWASGLAVNAVSKRMATELENIVPGSDLRAAHDRLQTMIDLLDEAQAVEDGGGAPVPEKLRQLVDDAKANAGVAAQDDGRAATAIEQKKRSIQSIASAVAREVVAQIDTVKSAMRSLGAGSMAGRGLRVNAPAKQMHERLRKNPKLARVAALAGRLKAEAAKKQATKTQYAREEVTSITVGGDVARLVPSELTYLGDELTELILLRKLTERAALEYELTGTEQATQGPIILAVDESGSMRGRRDEWAKSVAITLMDIASKQKREFALIHFDSRVTRVDRPDVRAGLKLEVIESMVEHFSGGGTDISKAMKCAVDIVAKAKESNAKLAKADLVIVSDGEDHSLEYAAWLVGAAKELGMAIHGIAIQDSFSGKLLEACSTYTEISDADFAREGAIDTVLSI